MSSNPFEPYTNSIRLNTSTTSVRAGPFPSFADTVVITNNADTSAWVVGSADPAVVSVFPTLDDPNGAPGQEVLPHSQVSLGYSSVLYVAVVLAAGTGTVTISVGDGL